MSVSIDENNVTGTVSQDIQVDNEQVVGSIVNEYPNTITVKSNEYAIVGDGLFATTKEEVPGWMQSLVNDLARSVTVDAYNAMAGFNYNLYNAMLALQVAENKYQQAINTRITDQEAFVQAVETLNSTVQNSESEIVSIKQTYATRDFAVATAAETLEASINGGAIKSSLGSLASSMTNQYGTMAQRMDVLESTFENLELGVEGYANATSTLETYLGVVNGVPNGVSGLSKAVTDLGLDLSNLDDSIYGTSGLQQTLEGAISTEGARVESKFAYNSNLTLNGVPYSSGFGLATSINDSTIPTGSSEFWISADKFKMTTTGYNGTKYSPFTVNGSTGEISFNGKVSFSNVTGTGSLLTTSTDLASQINSNTTTIDGSKITTGSISATQIAAGTITADSIASNVISVDKIASSLQSINYSPGISGWLINKSGPSEFNSDVVFNGTVAVSKLVGAVVKAHSIGLQSLNGAWGNHTFNYVFNHPSTGLNGKTITVAVMASAYQETGNYNNFFNQGVGIRLRVNGTEMGFVRQMGGYAGTATAVGSLTSVTAGNFTVTLEIFNTGHDTQKYNYSLVAFSYVE